MTEACSRCRGSARCPRRAARTAAAAEEGSVACQWHRRGARRDLVAGCGESRSTRVLTGAAGGAVAGQVIADEPVAGASPAASSAP